MRRKIKFKNIKKNEFVFIKLPEFLNCIANSWRKCKVQYFKGSKTHRCFITQKLMRFTMLIWELG